MASSDQARPVNQSTSQPTNALEAAWAFFIDSNQPSLPNPGRGLTLDQRTAALSPPFSPLVRPFHPANAGGCGGSRLAATPPQGDLPILPTPLGSRWGHSSPPVDHLIQEKKTPQYKIHSGSSPSPNHATILHSHLKENTAAGQ